MSDVQVEKPSRLPARAHELASFPMKIGFLIVGVIMFIAWVIWL